MTYDEALQKAVKLLRLSQSSNPNEAALAASKAQEIIDRYQIESTALNLDGQAPDEPIKDFNADPLEPGRKLDSWKWRLFLVIGKANGCKGYLSGRGGIAVVGRPSDVATVRYFFAWLVQEVNRLAERDCRGNGRTYANNYRHGVIDTLGQRLNAQRRETQEQMRKEIELMPEVAQSLALVRLNSAIAQVEKRETQAADWMKANLRLINRSGSGFRGDHSARSAGRVAGHEIRLKPAKASLHA